MVLEYCSYPLPFLSPTINPINTPPPTHYVIFYWCIRYKGSAYLVLEYCSYPLPFLSPTINPINTPPPTHYVIFYWCIRYKGSAYLVLEYCGRGDLHSLLVHRQSSRHRQKQSMGHTPHPLEHTCTRFIVRYTHVIIPPHY